MLPVSGAAQLNTSGAKPTRPMISQSGAYSRLVRPAPYSLAGRNRFQSPASFAFAFSSSIMGGIVQRSPARVLAVEGRLVRMDVLVHEARELLLEELRLLAVLELHGVS